MGLKSITIFYILLQLTETMHAQGFRSEALVGINSAYDEQNARISADGKYLFVTRSNHPQNVGGPRDLGDIWIATHNGTGWDTPVHGGDLINDEGYNSVAGMSADGTRLYLLYHLSADGLPLKTQGISVATGKGKEWSQPINIHIPYFHTRSSIISGYLTKDENYLVYSADTYGTLGVEDLYIVKKENGKWTEPQNLGASINSSFQELSPSLNQNGDTLFFSTNGRDGKGSFDVFASARLDDTWTKWSTPVNLTDINTEGRELYYTLLGKGAALYSTTRNSDGYGDIRMAIYKEQPLLVLSDSVTAQITEPDPTITILQADNNSIRLKGIVQNSETNEAIEAEITFVSDSGRTVEKAGRKGYAVDLVSTTDYKVIIEAKGFISVYETIKLSTYQLKEVELDFALKPIEIGTTVNLKSVLFKQSSTEMLAESMKELDVVASFMRTNPSVKIQLAGHTDNRGVQKDNVKLSQARVEKVKAYLVSRGIASKRMTGKGYGGSRPIASSDT